MIGAVVRASWTNLKRDRGALILSFVVPVVFFSIFAMIFGGQKRGGTDPIEIAVVDEDGSAASQRFVAAIAAEPSFEAQTKASVREGEPAVAWNAAEAERMVREGEVPVAIVVPPGFGEARMSFAGGAAGAGAAPGAAGAPGATPAGPRVRLLADTSDPIAPQVASGILQKVAMTALPQLFARGGMEAMDMWGGGLLPEQRTTLERNLAEFERISASPSPGAKGAAQGTAFDGGLLGVDVVDVLGATMENPIVAFYAAAIGVMFLLFTASHSGGTLLEEQESGTLDRILTTRVSMGGLLAGKLVYLVLLGLTQLVVMFVWGAVVFGLDLLGHLPGFAVMAVATTLATSAFGLVLAAACRTRAQLSAMTTLVVLTISAMGGSMFPRFLMPDAMQKASLVFFNSWALEGFIKVFWREEPLAAIWPEVAVLLGWTVVFYLAARRLARRWEVV